VDGGWGQYVSKPRRGGYGVADRRELGKWLVYPQFPLQSSLIWVEHEMTKSVSSSICNGEDGAAGGPNFDLISNHQNPQGCIMYK
jgi:hypothetical protein